MPIGPYGVGLWKFIWVGWDSFSVLKFEVGNGSRIRFWDDVWCTDGSLKDAYPELYRIACIKDALVADYIHFRGDFVHWEVNFTRLAQDWELESVSPFLDLLYSIPITRIGEDKVCWKPSQVKGFRVNSYYKALSPNGVASFLWKAKVPPRVAFSAWTAALGENINNG